MEAAGQHTLECDSVCWVGPARPFCCYSVPATHPQALHLFREQGKRLLFVTNNSSKSRQQYVAKFASLGISVTADEVGTHILCSVLRLCTPLTQSEHTAEL